MSAGFPRYRRTRLKRCRFHKWGCSEWQKTIWEFHPAVLTLLVAFTVFFVLAGGLENRLRPVLLTAARMQTTNAITVIAEEAILDELERQKTHYSDLVHVERGPDGTIAAITTDMSAMNRLRGTLIEAILEQVSQIDEEAIAIPVGSLIDSELIWGRGPTIKVRSFTIGTVSAEFRSEFLSAGVNQTLHKIWLDLSVPTTVLLPGTQLNVSVETGLCIAETVIVGTVPSYIQRTAYN